MATDRRIRTDCKPRKIIPSFHQDQQCRFVGKNRNITGGYQQGRKIYLQSRNQPVHPERMGYLGISRNHNRSTSGTATDPKLDGSQKIAVAGKICVLYSRLHLGKKNQVRKPFLESHYVRLGPDDCRHQHSLATSGLP